MICEFCQSINIVETNENYSCLDCSKIQPVMLYESNSKLHNRSYQPCYKEGVRKSFSADILHEIAFRYGLSTNDVHQTLNLFNKYKSEIKNGFHSNNTILCYSLYKTVGVSSGFSFKKVCEMFGGGVTINSFMRFKRYLSTLENISELDDSTFILKNKISFLCHMLNTYSQNVKDEIYLKAENLF